MIPRLLSSAPRIAVLGLAIAAAIARSFPAGAVQSDIAHPMTGETAESAACRIVEDAAQANRLPVGFLTRLVWAESRFQAGVTSPAGAQGIAQFMPDIAAQRRLADPFDPEQAIPKAAQLLADLVQRYGNLGLAAAAYNAGSSRVAEWLGGSAALPVETQAYVLTVTGRAAADWAADRRETGLAEVIADGQSCAEVTAALRATADVERVPLAPWGVQLAGSFSKAAALATFERARQRFGGIFGGLRPMIVGTVLRSRGTRPFYRVLLPAATRLEADRMCQSIMADGGACVALRS